MSKKKEREDSYNKNEYTNSQELEVGEDATKYGEFISSYFAWITLPEQKEKAKKLEKITESDKNKENGRKN